MTTDGEGEEEVVVPVRIRMLLSFDAPLYRTLLRREWIDLRILGVMKCEELQARHSLLT